jgi:putative isomerase
VANHASRLRIEVKLQLSYEPFSRYGSYLAIGWEEDESRFAPPRGSGWYIRSHHARAVIRRELFLLKGLVDGQKAELSGEATATEMILRPEGGVGEVRICFDERGNLRLRGCDMGLCFLVPTGGGVVSYSEAPGIATVNARLATRRYQFEAMCGDLRLETSWEGVSAGETRVEVLPDSDATFEVAIDEFWSTWVRPQQRETFEQVLDDAQADFASFRDGFGRPPQDAKLAAAWERAAYICWSTVVRPEGQLARPTMYMSKNWMDQVWSWDNCFNAQALARGHQSLAWDQWLVVFDHQDEFGAIPDGLNDVFKHYNFCKPPVHGWTLSELLRRAPDRPENNVLEQAYRKLARHTRWFLTRRRLEGQALQEL